MNYSPFLILSLCLIFYEGNAQSELFSIIEENKLKREEKTVFFYSENLAVIKTKTKSKIDEKFDVLIIDSILKSDTGWTQISYLTGGNLPVRIFTMWNRKYKPVEKQIFFSSDGSILTKVKYEYDGTGRLLSIEEFKNDYFFSKIMYSYFNDSTVVTGKTLDPWDHKLIFFKSSKSFSKYVEAKKDTINELVYFKDSDSVISIISKWGESREEYKYKIKRNSLGLWHTIFENGIIFHNGAMNKYDKTTTREISKLSKDAALLHSPIFNLLKEVINTYPIQLKLYDTGE